MKDLIEKAKAFALEEIKKYDSPNEYHFDIANKAGQSIAEKVGADKDIVLLGTMLMDLKKGQAIFENGLRDHIQMSADAARLFLVNEKAPSDLVSKVVDCVLSHHGTVPFKSKEAEVCANADCYRFLMPQGVFAFAVQLGKREMDLPELLDYVDKKVDEKWGIVSLSSVKLDLETNYKELKDLLSKARTFGGR